MLNAGAESAQKDRPLQIFVLGARAFPGMQGGVERDCEVMCDIMAQEGMAVTALTMRCYQKVREWKGIRFISLPVLGSHGLEKVIYNLLGVLVCLWRRPDAVLVISITSAIFLFLLRWAGIPVVLRMVSRDYLHDKWGWFARKMILWGEYNARFADHVVCNSYDYYLYLKNTLHLKNVSHVPPGLPFAENFLSTEKDTEILDRLGLTTGGFILSVGRLTEEKGVDVLLDAFIETGPENPLSLVVVGDGEGPYADAIRKKGAKHQQILLVGQMVRQEIGALYRHCSLFVQPSRFEGMPNTLLEAIFFDCKILVSDIPATRELRFDSAYIFPSGDKKALAAKLSNHLRHPTQQPNYQPIKALYNWTTSTRSFIGLFREIVTKKQSKQA